MKKAVPKKLDFSHLQNTFDAISRRVNTLPTTLGEQQSILPEQPTSSKSKDDVNKHQGPQVEPITAAMPNSDSIDRVATDELQRKLDSIRKWNNTVRSTSVTQPRILKILHKS
ncbi:hypothetical protein PIB30_038065 [Stylosanthes scabra]|uniref:Uncharacterized protein n=1 Tax=Stylosanthes scabra TaxID=79078 RepID=A0ABU6WEW0_9FABA|nr:hypothetical protein [Stylosanthes scabra]